MVVLNTKNNVVIINLSMLLCGSAAQGMAAAQPLSYIPGMNAEALRKVQ